VVIYCAHTYVLSSNGSRKLLLTMRIAQLRDNGTESDRHILLFRLSLIFAKIIA